jgi:hypothetical protein
MFTTKRNIQKHFKREKVHVERKRTEICIKEFAEIVAKKS